MYERTPIPSRFVPLRPGPPATNCRDARGRTPGQRERGLTCQPIIGVLDIERKFEMRTFSKYIP